MNVDVRFFASLRETVGRQSLRLELAEGADLEALMAALEDRLGATAVAPLRAENVRLARNQELVQPPVDLVDGDELAFLPPVTGG